MAIKMYGVRITLDDAADPVAELESIGLRNVVSANSEILVSQNTVVDAPEWCGTALAENGIGDWYIGYDSILGGAVAKLGNVKISLVNSINLQTEFDTRGLSLTGLKAELVEITDTTVVVLQTGKIEQPEWDSSRYSFVIKSDENTRDAVICKEVNEVDYPYSTTDNTGTLTVPVTLGESRPVTVNGTNIKIYNKCLRVAGKDIQWVSSDSLAFEGIRGTGYSVFTFYEKNSDTKYGVRLFLYSEVGDSTIINNELVGSYIHIIAGATGLKGSYRRIVSVSTTVYSPGYIIEIEIEYPFTVEPTYTTATLFEILLSRSQHVIDFWPLHSFVDELGAPIVDEPFVLAYDNQYEALPDSTFISGLANNTRLDLRLKNTDDSITNIKENMIRGVGTIDYCNSDTMVIQTPEGLKTFSRYADGVYKLGLINFPTITKTGGREAIMDKDGATFAQLGSEGTVALGSCAFIYSVKHKKPDNCLFTKTYLGIHSQIGSVFAPLSVSRTHIINIIVEHFSGERYISTYIVKGPSSYDTDNFDIQNIPARYYIQNIPTGADASYEIRASGSFSETGKELFELTLNGLSIDNKNIGAISNIYVAACMNLPTTLSYIDYSAMFAVYDIALFYYKEYDVAGSLYTPSKGRTFNDTWGTRKTATEMISTPREIIEHACRLQNYSDLQAEPTAGWGKAYASAAKIRTGTGVGAFDVEGQSFGRRPAFQLFDKDKATTLELKKLMCKEYNQISFVDKDGYECIDDIWLEATSPETAITYANILDSDGIRVTPPNTSDIYCEPTIRFNLNYATGEYQSFIQVTHSSASTYAAGYVIGMADGALARAIWAQCHRLWLMCRTVNEMPTDLSDMITANGPDSQNIAERYLYNIVMIMGLSQVSFNVPSALVYEWEPNKRFTLTLPHQTNGATVECVLKSRLNKTQYPFDCDVEAYMITSDDIPSLIEWQDTFSTGTEYQDTFSTGTEYQDTF